MRDRYCDLKATNLKEVLETCDRHLKNLRLVELDLADNEDETDSDRFYIDMMRGMWSDLRDDVEAIINKDPMW